MQAIVQVYSHTAVITLHTGRSNCCNYRFFYTTPSFMLFNNVWSVYNVLYHHIESNTLNYLFFQYAKVIFTCPCKHGQIVTNTDPQAEVTSFTPDYTLSHTLILKNLKTQNAIIKLWQMISYFSQYLRNILNTNDSISNYTKSVFEWPTHGSSTKQHVA